MHVRRSADPNDIEIGNSKEVRPIPHRCRLRTVLFAKLLRAFVSRIRDRDNLGVRMFFQRRKMPALHNAARPYDANSKLVIALLGHALVLPSSSRLSE